jgi:hypothetical protein
LNESGFAGAGVVGDVENGAQLNHGGPPWLMGWLKNQALPSGGT